MTSLRSRRLIRIVRRLISSTLANWGDEWSLYRATWDRGGFLLCVIRKGNQAFPLHFSAIELSTPPRAGVSARRRRVDIRLRAAVAEMLGAVPGDGV